MHLTSHGSKQVCPNRAACWSPRITAIGTQALYYKVEHDLIEERYADMEASGTMPRQVWVDQDAENNKYQWMNEGKTYAKVPVDSAIQVLAKHKGKVPSTQPSR